MSTTNNIQKVTINSALINKEEAMRVVALGTICKLPILLLGEKGTAKTQTALDFANSFMGTTINDAFVVELSHDSKKSELLGRPDMQDLITNKKWTMERPICESKVVVINEVDKGTTAVRNVLLSVMSERKVHDGRHSQDCIWETFVGTANEIPKGEEGAPFWDRWIITYKMPTVTNADLMKFMKSDRKAKPVLELNMPDYNTLVNTSLNYDIVKIFLDLLDSQQSGKDGIKFSDRAKTKLDILIKGATYIWGYSETDAACKIAELFCPSILAELGKKMLPKELNDFKSVEEQFLATSANLAKSQLLNKLEKAVKNLGVAASKKPELKKAYLECEAKFNKYKEDYMDNTDFDLE